MSAHAKAVVYPFPSYEKAQEAYQELLQIGFEEAEVELRTFDDEAGPVSGNFILEYKESDHGRDNSVLDKVTTSDDPNEGLGRQPVTWRTVALVAVTVASHGQSAKLENLKQRWGEGVG